MKYQTMHDYERGYLDGQRHLDAGGKLWAGSHDPQTAPAYTQGYVDGFDQTQGRIPDPLVPQVRRSAHITPEGLE